jgi:ABC-2 type transport system ATP-binding protein
VKEIMTVVHAAPAGRRAHLVVRVTESQDLPRGWQSDSVSLEELVLAYLREPTAANFPGPSREPMSQHGEVTR